MFKVFYIEVIDYDKLSLYSSQLWSRNLPIEGERGTIYDQNGKELVSNVTTTSVVIIPVQVTDKEKVANSLSEILGVSYEEIYERVIKKSSIERLHPYGRHLTYDIADKIRDLNLDGVYLVKEYQRHYPFATLLSHTLGFVGIDNQGLSGIELMYNSYLTGAYGAIKYFSDAKGNRLELSEIYEEPQDGINISLTVNYEIQASLERELNNAVIKYNPDQVIGIVMNPKTGEILAMSSKPDYDPANYQDYSEETINRNLPIWATFEPGSTFKIITLAASLEEKIVDLNKDTFYDRGSISVENARIKCWKTGGHGLQTYMQVVQNSCNLVAQREIPMNAQKALKIKAFQII